MLKRYLFFILLIITSKCFGQKLTEDNFVEIEPPARYTCNWSHLNASTQKMITVSIQNNKLVIELNKTTDELNSYELLNGTLNFINRGEFGGSFYYKPKDSTIKNIYINNKKNSTLVNPKRHSYFSDDEEDPIKKNNQYFALPGGNINTIFKFKDTIYFTSGLAHMSFNYGSLTKLVVVGKNKFYFSKELDLRGAPMTQVIANDKIIFVTFDGIIEYNKYDKVVSMEKQYWASLYPNSVAYIDDQNIFIGMRGSFAKVDLLHNTVKCYVLKN